MIAQLLKWHLQNLSLQFLRWIMAIVRKETESKLKVLVSLVKPWCLHSGKHIYYGMCPFGHMYP